MVTIYMPLVNEGTDVWRPVEATSQGNDIYRIESRMDEDEEWAFAPDTSVRCEWKTFSDDERRLIAVAVAD